MRWSRVDCLRGDDGCYSPSWGHTEVCGRRLDKSGVDRAAITHHVPTRWRFTCTGLSPTWTKSRRLLGATVSSSLTMQHRLMALNTKGAARVQWVIWAASASIQTRISGHLVKGCGRLHRGCATGDRKARAVSAFRSQGRPDRGRILGAEAKRKSFDYSHRPSLTERCSPGPSSPRALTPVRSHAPIKQVSLAEVDKSDGTPPPRIRGHFTWLKVLFSNVLPPLDARISSPRFERDGGNLIGLPASSEFPLRSCAVTSSILRQATSEGVRKSFQAQRTSNARKSPAINQ